MSDERLQYTVKRVTDISEVPSWARREAKYDELKDLVRSLEPGQTIVIEFEDRHAAERARNVVRYELNREIGQAAIRTRLVANQSDGDAENSGPAEVYFSRLEPIDIIESDE